MRLLHKWKLRFGKFLIILGVAIAAGVLVTDLMAGLASTGAVSSHGGHGSESVPVTHSAAAIYVAILGSGVILAGLVLSSINSLRSVQTLSLVAGLTLLYADGVVHWLAVTEHIGEPLSAIFFVFSGGIQVGAVPLVKRREKLLWWVGVALTVFFIELYILTRIVPPPFSLEPESLESLGTLSKAIEIGLLVALGLFFGSRMVPNRLRGALTHGPSLAFLFLGASVSLLTINLEVQWYWWVLSLTAFVLTAFLMIGLIAHAALAHYLKTGYLVGITWSFALMLMMVHVVYAVDYARASLAFPLLLCIVSGTLLTASVLPYHGRWIIGPRGGLN